MEQVIKETVPIRNMHLHYPDMEVNNLEYRFREAFVKRIKNTYSVIAGFDICSLSLRLGPISIERHFETNKHSKTQLAATTARAELSIFFRD